MIEPHAVIRPLVVLFGSLALASCATRTFQGEPVPIRYVGSSTIASFVRAAEPVYRRARFTIDTAAESEGGEQAILEGATDLAGVANRPRAETLRTGVASALIGRDAIAVIVNAKNPVTNLSLANLTSVFTGKVANWSELGGPDLPVAPFIVGSASATRTVFRDAVLQGVDYAGCAEITPDPEIIAAVAAAPGGIGQISFSFLEETPDVRAIGVDGERPSVTNFTYPIVRPLYLLWRESRPEIDAFANWAQTPEGQRVVMQRFVGIRVVGSAAETRVHSPATGRLIVYTETYPVYDGGVYYYPHRPYELLTRYGELIRRVPNHRGQNDENAMRITLPPGTYLVRPQTQRGRRPEFFVTVKPGETQEIDVRELGGRK